VAAFRDARRQECIINVKETDDGNVWLSRNAAKEDCRRHIAAGENRRIYNGAKIATAAGILSASLGIISQKWQKLPIKCYVVGDEVNQHALFCRKAM
jgi:hypothetical protein